MGIRNLIFAFPFLITSILPREDSFRKYEPKPIGICSSSNFMIKDVLFKINICSLNQPIYIKCSSGEKKPIMKFSEIFPYFINAETGELKTLNEPEFYWYDLNNDKKLTEEEVFLNNENKEFDCYKNLSPKNLKNLI